MSEKRRRKPTSRASMRRAKVARGRRVVLACLTAASTYYVLIFALTAAGDGFGLQRFIDNNFVALLLVGIFSLTGVVLAIGAFRGQPVMRPLFLILNIVMMVLGIFWIGWHFATARADMSLLFDFAGVGAALSVCWAFLGSRHARTFFEEQEFNVKRT